MFVDNLPAKQRIMGLERELKEVYAREATLQTRLAQLDPRLKDQQVTALRAERDALVRRIERLERELAEARPRDAERQ
jgi:predicted  nucleic acid-binding Zn-ribbon protein